VLKIIGSKSVEVIGDWRKLHNDKLHNMNSLFNIIRIINSCMEDMRNARKLSENLKEGKRLHGILSKDGRIILKWTLRK
jgi:hypothetical protein